MITARDVRRHEPPTNDPTFAETNYFGFYMPEEGINCAIYVLLRPNVGVALSAVALIQGENASHYDALYCDYQVHLPMPAGDLDDFELANGLKIKAVDPPAGYEIDYVGYGGTEVHVAYEALMPPYDINDVEMDPIAAAEQGEAAGWDAAYKGHYDQTGEFTGEVRVRGKSYNVNCVSTMDHSWGVRPEMDLPTISWLHAHFGRDLAVHCIFSIDPYRTDEMAPFAYGYILEDGEVYGLTGGKGRASRDRFQLNTIELDVTDVRGKRFNVTGNTIANCPWVAWPGICDFQSLVRWELAGRIGYGEVQDVLPVSYIVGQRPN